MATGKGRYAIVDLTLLGWTMDNLLSNIRLYSSIEFKFPIFSSFVPEFFLEGVCVNGLALGEGR